MKSLAFWEFALAVTMCCAGSASFDIVMGRPISVAFICGVVTGAATLCVLSRNSR